ENYNSARQSRARSPNGKTTRKRLLLQLTVSFVGYNRSLVPQESREATSRFLGELHETLADQISLPVLSVHAPAVPESLASLFCRRTPDQARRRNVRFQI